jgi:hypothetical protein
MRIAELGLPEIHDEAVAPGSPGRVHRRDAEDAEIGIFLFAVERTAKRNCSGASHPFSL